MTHLSSRNMSVAEPDRPKYKEKANLVRLKRSLEIQFEKNHHWAIRLTKTRAVIGEPYEMARKAEVLVTFRGMHPVYISMETLEETLSEPRLLERDTEYVYTVIKRKSEAYMKIRRPVRHWVFREPEPNKR